METEAQLLNSIRRGDRDARRRLYDRFVPLCTATALRYLGESDEVRDVLQDSFVRIFGALDSFRHQGEGSLKSWITTIVAHQACDFLRSTRRIDLIDIDVDMLDEETEPPIEEMPPDMLMALIRRLPSGCRTVLNLHVFERMPHKEIALRLGITPDTSASQFSRAKKQLAQLIENYQKTGKI